MKELLIIKDSLANKITYYHLLLFLVMLPYERFYSELILVSLLIHSLIHVSKKKIISLPKQFLFLISIFLLAVTCSIYSPDKQQAFKDVEKQLALFLFPLIFFITDLDLKKYKMHLLKAFAFSCVLTVIYLYADALRIIKYDNLPLSSLFKPEFTNHNFSLPIGLHATYLAMYVAVSLTLFLYELLHTENFLQKIYLVCCIVISALAIVQLSSRSVFIASFLMINFAFPFFVLQKKTRIKFILISFFISVLTIFAIVNINDFKNRFVTELKNDLESKRNDLTTSESRATRWSCAWQLIQESPVIGHGTGSEVKLLKQKYFENRFYVSYINELNAHNEYLSMAIKSGMAGLALYLYFLAAGFANAYKRKDVFFLSFLTIIVFVSLSENILDTNKGIFFFSFFFALFAWPMAEYKLPGVQLRISKHKNLNLPQTENMHSQI